MYSKVVEVIGTGYVGLPLALFLAKNGVSVLGVDKDIGVIEKLENFTLRLGEKEVDSLFEDENVQKNLRASLKPEVADIFVIAVQTPIIERRKIADLSYVKSALLDICPFLEKGNLVIIESTIPPLTCRDIIKPLIEANTKLKVNDDIYIAHCPERILPGDIYNEIRTNSRIIGGMNEIASNMAKEMYKIFVEGDIKITDDITAELSKLVENAYRDVNIAFANEIAQVAEGLGVESENLIELANMHPRVRILKPGIGVGGHCIAVDPWFLKEIDNDNTGLIQTARRINDNRPFSMVKKIRKYLSRNHIINPSILLLGAAYKPNTSDLRESPSLKIYDLLKDEGYRVTIKDPINKEYLYSDINEVVKDKDVIVVLVKHDKVMKDINLIKNKYTDRLIIELP